MHHYKMLESKIAGMETRHMTRENELKKLLENSKLKSSLQVAHIEDKWKDMLRDKDMEILKFREELDAILEVLRELNRQGIIVPLTTYQMEHIT